MLPSVHGQSAVMRILDRSNIQVNIRELGFSEEDYIRFQNIIKAPERHLPGHRSDGVRQDHNASTRR